MWAIKFNRLSIKAKRDTIPGDLYGAGSEEN
jgi:hypothetical protein